MLGEGPYGAEKNKEYSLLKRVFDEQYKVESGPGGGKKKKIKPLDKSDVSAKSVQNPHDVEAEYRDKNGNKVKGYSLNITETCEAGQLNLILGVQTAGCGKPDVEYLQEGIEKAQELVSDKIEEAYTDGGYHSPGNQEYCKKHGIDFVLDSIPGAPSKYDISFNSDGALVVLNTKSGEQLEATKTKRRDPQAPERWGIKDGDRMIYFERKDVDTCDLRKRIEGTPKERLDIRNNVEATIFQLGYHYRCDKSRYRGQMKHSLWAIIRCIWVNFRRIQLWISRKAGNNENSAAVIFSIPMLNFLVIFLRSFLCRFRVVFYQPVFAGSY
jgi:hypothetical protein